jgi:hypothetical protein
MPQRWEDLDRVAGPQVAQRVAGEEAPAISRTPIRIRPEPVSRAGVEQIE